MKNDINLFIKRKNTKNTKKIVAGVFIGVVLLAAFAAVGILLPMNNRVDAQAKLAGLEQQLQSFDFTEEDLLGNTERNAMLTQQLEELTRLHESRSDILAYLGDIENALPTSAQITYMSLTGNQLQITGTAPGDAEVATLSLHLRESDLFSSVFVSTSTLSEESDGTMFTLTAALPVSLSGEALVESGSETDGENSDEAPEQTEEVSS
jgi:Tfp pilus assembly protein PilN